MEYPEARRDESIVESPFGVTVSDPYRWLEEPDSEETRAFVSAQNELSRPMLDSCPWRDDVVRELLRLWNHERIGVPQKEGDFYFFTKNDVIQTKRMVRRKSADVTCLPNSLYSVMYKQRTLDGEPVLFLDPNRLSPSGGAISLTLVEFSPDGSTLAYGLATAGADWFDVHFKNVLNGLKLKDELRQLRYTRVTWLHSMLGVFYAAYPDQVMATGKDTTVNVNQKLFFHAMGTEQSADKLCLSFPDHPQWRLDAEVSDCGRYLLVCPREFSTQNLVYICDLSQLPNNNVELVQQYLRPIVTHFYADFEYVTNSGNNFVFRTNSGASKYRLAIINSDKLGRTDTSLVAEHQTNVLEWAACVHNDKLVLCYLQDAKNVLQVHDLSSGKHLYDFDLGSMGSVVGFSGKRSCEHVFVKFSSIIQPGIIYHIDMSHEKPRPKVYMETTVSGFDSRLYHVSQVFYPSVDSTSIPMFIASRRDEPVNGNSPCLLYGYGGFNVALTPQFSMANIFFMKHLGHVAMANIRGGGEYGQQWHDAGRLLNKQRSFDDFLAAAKFLVEKNYTSEAKLAIKGVSNGGLLVAACLTQRPEFFGAAIASVGVFDMLRFHLFTIGHAWKSEYGDPEKREHWLNLIQYSPLHNVRRSSSECPAVLLMTGDHDDRVVPSHSLKLIAELQHVHGDNPDQTKPLLAYVDTHSGHGSGKSSWKAMRESADELCFLINSLRLNFRQERVYSVGKRSSNVAVAKTSINPWIRESSSKLAWTTVKRALSNKKGSSKSGKNRVQHYESNQKSAVCVVS